MSLTLRSLSGAAILCALCCTAALLPTAAVIGGLGIAAALLRSWQAGLVALSSVAAVTLIWYSRRPGADRSSPSSAPEAEIACTLSGSDMATRLGEIAQLTRDALIGVKRDGLTLELLYNQTARERVTAMVEKERLCCAFLTFAIDDNAAGLRVTITAPENARPAAEMIFKQFGKGAVARTGCC